MNDIRTTLSSHTFLCVNIFVPQLSFSNFIFGNEV